MIQDELDIFAEDHTGMPDFALQSMGMLLNKISPIIIFGHCNVVVRRTWCQFFRAKIGSSHKTYAARFTMQDPICCLYQLDGHYDFAKA